MAKAGSGESGLRLTRLKVRDFKRIELVDVALKNGAVVVAGANAAGKCVPEGTPVSLWDGSRKTIESVRETDALVGLDPDTWRFRAEHPLALSTSGVQDVLRITTKRGHRVTLTAGHRLLTPDGWTESGRLSVGDALAVPMRLPCEGGGVSEEEALLVGLLLGDGCVSAGNLSLSATNPDVAGEFVRCVENLFPACIIRVQRQKNGGKTWTASKGRKSGRQRGPHLEWLHGIGLAGKNAYTKEVPPRILSGGRDAIRACLRGLILTDGWIGHDGSCGIGSRSPNLVDAAASMFLRLGIVTSRTVQTKAGKPFYKVSVVTARGREAFSREMLDLVPASRISGSLFHGPQGRSMARAPSQAYSVPPPIVARLSDAGGRNLSAWTRAGRGMSQERLQVALSEVSEPIAQAFGRFVSPDVGWDPIATIEPAGRTQTFDLQMPSEAFVANDFIVHNSSLLDAVLALFGGKRVCPPRPVRLGAESAEIVGELGDADGTPALEVMRMFEPDGTTTVRVRSADGAEFRSPQARLDEMAGPFLDPLAFTRLRPAEQRAALLDLLDLGAFDLAASEGRERAAREDRAAVNRDLARVGAERDGMGLPPDLPSGPVPDLSACIRDLQEAERVGARIQAADRGAKDAARHAIDAAEAVEATRRAEDRRVEEAKRALAEADQERARRIQTAEAAAAAARERAEALAAELASSPCPDANTAAARVEAARAVEAAVAKRDRWRELDARAVDLESKSGLLAARIVEEKISRDRALAAAGIPVEGLALADAGLEYRGVPFAQASQSEQLRIAVGLAMARRPRLRVLRVQEAAVLDRGNLRALVEAAAAAGCQQLLLETLDPEGADLVIADGRVASEATSKKESKPKAAKAPRKGR